MTQNKCKIEIPSQLPDSGLTRVQFKSWKESMLVYLKQNDDFLHFLPDGKYENWTAAEENKYRITALHADDTPTNQADQEQRLSKRQRDLSSMLSIIARKVDQYDYNDVIAISTSVNSIWMMIELVYDIGRKGIHFLDLAKLKCEAGESPTKFYKKVYHHFMDNLYKKDDALKYKKSKQPEDEKLSPTLLNFILFHTIQSIDTRLLKEIRDKWGHLLDTETCLHDYKDTILKAIPDLIKQLDTKEYEANAISTLAAFQRYGRGRGTNRGGQVNVGRTRQLQARRGGGQRSSRLFCRLCQTARSPYHVYTSHNISDCNRWTKKDVEDLRVMICELKYEPDMYPDSSDENDQE